MPGVDVAEVSRKAIEELFESRYDREYAKFCIEDDLAELAARWERTLGLKTGVTITATEDGFRIVLVSLKRYGAEAGTEPAKEVSEPEAEKSVDALDDWED